MKINSWVVQTLHEFEWVFYGCNIDTWNCMNARFDEWFKIVFVFHKLVAHFQLRIFMKISNKFNKYYCIDSSTPRQTRIHTHCKTHSSSNNPINSPTGFKMLNNSTSAKTRFHPFIRCWPFISRSPLFSSQRLEIQDLNGMLDKKRQTVIIMI